MKEFLAVFHDERGLYEDLVLISEDYHNDGTMLENYKNHPNELVTNVFELPDDGWWKLTKLIEMDEIPTVQYT